MILLRLVEEKDAQGAESDADKAYGPAFFGITLVVLIPRHTLVEPLSSSVPHLLDIPISALS